MSHGERHRVAGLKLDFKVLLICLVSLSEGVPQVASKMHPSLLCFEEIQMRNFIAPFGNAFYKSNTELVQFCMKTKAFPTVCCYYQKCHQVTQFPHSNAIFSDCQMTEEYHYEAENKSPAYASSFHLHHP